MSGPPGRGSSDGLVELVGVTKRFGPVTAVDDISLVVPPGTFVSLLGPSGCGKTTTLRMLAGFEHPDVGEIRISGTDVAGVPPYRRDVNTVFQQYALFPHLTVWDNVAFGPRSLPRRQRPSNGELRRRVDEVLAVVRLSEFAHRRPAQLSGGQQQRVALARALINRPSALLLDEPLGALDLKLRQAMQLELKRIHAAVGTTFILVTHDQEEALTMSDLVVVMNAGRIEQVGPPAEVYEFPATTFVAGFIGSANLWPAATRSNDVSVVEVAGTPVAAPHGRPSDGSPMVAMVRPERVRIASSPPDGGHGVPARLTEMVFQGAVVRCEAVLADGAHAVAHVPAAESANVTLGDVWLSWDAGALRLLPSSDRSGSASVQQQESLQ